MSHSFGAFIIKKMKKAIKKAVDEWVKVIPVVAKEILIKELNAIAIPKIAGGKIENERKTKMTKYVGEGCICKICKKSHYCPDGCSMHFFKDDCVCTSCYLRADLIQRERWEHEARHEKLMIKEGEDIE